MMVFEDNEAFINIGIKERSAALRNVLRTNRECLDCLYVCFSEEGVNIKYVNTKTQVADMFTKLQQC